MKKIRKIRWKTIRPYVVLELIALAVMIALAPIYYSSSKKQVRSDIEERTKAWQASNQFRTNWFAPEPTVSHSIWYSAVQLEVYLTDHQDSDEWLSDYRNCVHVGLLWDNIDHEKYERWAQWGSTYPLANGLFLNDSTLLLTIYPKELYPGKNVAELSESELEENDYKDNLPFRITQPRTYDLSKYFPREELKKIITAKDKGLWTEVSVWGRYDKDFVITITKVEVTVETPEGNEETLFTLVRPDYRPSDPGSAGFDPEATPDILLTSSNNPSAMYEGLCTEWEFEDEWPVLEQNPELAELLLRYVTKGAASVDQDRYFVSGWSTASAYYPEGLTAADRIASFLISDNGEITETEEPQATLYLIVDIDTVARNKAGRKILITCLFVQTAALIIMFWRYAVTRRDREVAELKHTFINAMAHELKTPVSVIRSTAEYLQTGARPEKQPHYFSVLTRESDSMDALLNRMLTYSRMTDENVTLQPEQNDWNAMINKTLASYSDRITDKGMKVVFKEQSSEQPMADPSLLEMVIDNLISNAVKYGDPDSTITIRTVDRKFTIRNKTDAFQGENLNEIWTPMYQTEQKKADSQTGGMGLAICASVLKQHNASYGAYREADGITFYFDLNRPLKRSTGFRLFSGIPTSMFMMLLCYFFAAVKIPGYLENDAVERFNGFPKTLFTIILLLLGSLGFGVLFIILNHLNATPGKTKAVPKN